MTVDCLRIVPVTIALIAYSLAVRRYANFWGRGPYFQRTKGKDKRYSPMLATALFTAAQKRCTISKVVADWHERKRRSMLPSIVRLSEQMEPRVAVIT